ncbi:MAG: MDR family MFS transporter [Gaiellaceae bacterium]|jgi:EmrB/QacA subfamily drug resistance transporter|nr:MFS transporter [Acidobacteriota bacterium]
MGSLRERLARTPPGYQFTIGRILAIYAGLMVALFLAALDQTIVATALPSIVGDLGGLAQYSWVFTAYMLASTVTVPLYGKLGDVYGRKPLIMFAIVVFVAGSALCGIAQNMTQLVIFRGVQGVGAGGLIPLAIAVVGAIIPPRDRGRYQGLIGAVFGAASILGPAVGGFIVDNTTWRWIFYVNVPVGAAALGVIAATMPRRAAHADRSIDWVGAALLALSSTSLLLGLVWGGRQYPWSSGHVVGSLVAAVIVFALFLVYERRVPETILPFGLIRNRIVAASLICMTLVGMAMFGTISYVPLFVQGVIGTSATSSGVVLTPLMLGAVTASFLSGQWVSRSGRTRPNALVGPIVLTAGLVLLWRMNVHTTNGQAARDMVLTGIGLGLMMQIFVLAVQNAVPRAAIGSATAMTQFARSIGGTLGVALMGVIVNQGLPSGAQNEVVHRLSAPGRAALAHALRPAFFAAMLVSALVFPIAFAGVKDLQLRRHVDEPVDVSGAAAAPPTRAE